MSKEFALFIFTENFHYEGFNWYLGDKGKSCDKTCKDVDMMNVAGTASKVIKVDDCTIMKYFLKYGKTTLTTTIRYQNTGTATLATSCR